MKVMLHAMRRWKREAVMVLIALLTAGVWYQQSDAAEVAPSRADNTNASEVSDPKYFSVGLSCHYAWWDPAVFTAGRIYGTIINGEPTLMHRPALSASVQVAVTQRWLIAGDFGFGRYAIGPIHSIEPFFYNYFGVSGSGLNVEQRKSNVHRYTANIMAQYRLESFMKLVFGMFYEGFSRDQLYKSVIVPPPAIPWPPFNFSKRTALYSLGGVSIGLVFPIRLIGSFFIEPEARAIASYGENQIVGIGARGALSFRYAVASTGLSLIAGFNVHYCWYAMAPKGILGGQRYDLRFGPHVGVAYSY